MKQYYNISIVTEDENVKMDKLIRLVVKKLNHMLFRKHAHFSVRKLDQPYAKSFRKLELAFDMACEEVPLKCPCPPDRYNAQREFGSDEPVWIVEGGCPFDEPNCLDCTRKRFLEKASTVVNKDPVEWYL